MLGLRNELREVRHRHCRNVFHQALLAEHTRKPSRSGVKTQHTSVRRYANRITQTNKRTVNRTTTLATRSRDHIGGRVFTPP